ncbi:MAG TPA: hypothetical protein PKA64_04780, partial [Myxococcota bacterium]|nr:hypothetical protein [Myxococcota bacterium]
VQKYLTVDNESEDVEVESSQEDQPVERSPEPEQPTARYGDARKLAQMNLWDRLGKDWDTHHELAQPTPTPPKVEDVAPTEPPKSTPRITRKLIDHYAGEHEGKSLSETDGTLSTSIQGDTPIVGTYYAQDSSEFGTGVKDGRLHKDGEVVNSSDLVRPGGSVEKGSRRIYAKDRSERHNFAFDRDENLLTSDPAVETMRQLDIVKNEARRHHHSSLVGGKEVTSAGTMKVREGKVEEVSDSSGHYKPSIVHTQQGVERLQKLGVMDEARSSVRLSPKGSGGELLMSGTEFGSWKDDIDHARTKWGKTGRESDLHAPERRIRDLHSKKTSTLNELNRMKSSPTSTGGEVEEPSAGVVQTPLLKPSEIKQRVTKTREDERGRMTRAMKNREKREEEKRLRMQRLREKKKLKGLDN